MDLLEDLSPYRLEVRVMTVFNPGSGRGLCRIWISVGSHGFFSLIEYLLSGKGGLIYSIATPRVRIFPRACTWRTLLRIPNETA